MTRATIDFGIDLGTTNSCIALFKEGDVEVIRNNEGFEYTPSAVWIDRNSRLHVGRRAKEQFEVDEENAAIEFKLQMGKAIEKTFKRSGRSMKPEELSAEVLKSLLGDVRQRLGEEVSASVITVPADFDLPQCDATRKAAQLAGLTASPLLQEPVAAALAYGFQKNAENVYWLVYDLGGGTFDAAVIQMREGLFRVVNHGGDKCLGGKLIDWAVVEHLMVPALLKQNPLPEFRRGNPRWRAAFAKLKLAAEQAKIRLSREEAADVNIEYLCLDDAGEAVQFDYEVKKGDLERLIEPLVLRSINICKKVLEEKRLAPGDLEKVVLVGGPTLTPYLRQRLADKVEGLGIPLEFSVDPLTIVAKGAAVFAATQRLESTAPVAVGEYVLQLEYSPVGADPEPLVGGKVQAPGGEDLNGYTVEFVDADGKPPWRSGQIRLGADGIFEATLMATRGRPNSFRIELLDASGRRCPTTPEKLTYTIGAASAEPPLIHSLGVAMINNEMQIVIPKGTALPARKRVVHQTGMVIRKGSDDRLVIPVVEGENVRRADRNRLVGTLEIRGDKLKRDLPAFSDIEITIEVDASRLVRAWAFLPVLDEEYGDVMRFNQGAPELDKLREEVHEEKRRLTRMRQRAEEMSLERALKVLERIDSEEMLRDLDMGLAAAPGDADAADKCQNRLLDLRMAVDEIEFALEWPALVDDANAGLGELRNLVDEDGTSRDKQRAEVFDQEVRRAIKAQDADGLWRQLKEVRHFAFELRWRQPAQLRYLMYQLEDMQGDMRDPKMAGNLLERARQALDQNDVSGLRNKLFQLIGLLPVEKRGGLKGYGGSTIR